MSEAHCFYSYITQKRALLPSDFKFLGFIQTPPVQVGNIMATISSENHLIIDGFMHKNPFPEPWKFTKI